MENKKKSGMKWPLFVGGGGCFLVFCVFSTLKGFLVNLVKKLNFVCLIQQLYNYVRSNVTKNVSHDELREITLSK